jgi:hypothetical protein
VQQCVNDEAIASVQKGIKIDDIVVVAHPTTLADFFLISM